MNPNKKVLLTVGVFVLAMVVIACSCSSIIPTPTVAPPPTVPPQPTFTPIPPIPMLGLAGSWYDPITLDQFEIAWQNGQYVVTSASWKGTSYTITTQSWDGSALTWSYYDTDLSLTVTHTTTSLNGDSLNADWSYSDNSSGSETLLRGIAPAATQSGSQEAIPGLAGAWYDPDTLDQFAIAWQNGQYVVTSVTWEGNSYSITTQSWDGSSLSWSYYDTDLSLTVTHTTTSVSGNSLYANWTYSSGSSGTETLVRGYAPTPTP